MKSIAYDVLFARPTSVTGFKIHFSVAEFTPQEGQSPDQSGSLTIGRRRKQVSGYRVYQALAFGVSRLR